MFSLMLDPRFNTSHLVFSLSDHKQGKAIVEEYDKIFVSNIFKMLLSFASFG
jgi:hypothetical protein